MGSKFITVNPGTLPDDNGLAFAFKGSGSYGGVTVVDVRASTGSVGTLDIALVNRGTSGTATASTIAHMTNGTATVWAADVPQSLTITAAQAYVDSGEFVYIKKVESASDNDLSADAAVCIEYVDGIVTQA